MPAYCNQAAQDSMAVPAWACRAVHRTHKRLCVCVVRARVACSFLNRCCQPQCARAGGLRGLGRHGAPTRAHNDNVACA